MSLAKFCDASYINFKKFTFDSKIIKWLVQYKKYSLTLTDFFNWLQEFIFYNPGDIILGDFSINAFHKNNRLLLVLSAYNQVVVFSVNVIDIYFNSLDVVKPKFIENFDMHNNLQKIFCWNVLKYLKRFLYNKFNKSPID